MVLAEVKLPGVNLRDLAYGTDRGDQIGRYLAQTGVVLVANVRAFGLVAVKPGTNRAKGKPLPTDSRELLEEVELWSSEDALGRGDPVAPEALERLGDLLERAVTEFAPIADPASLARILARQARRAKADLPQRFDAVAPLLEDYEKALGLAFDEEQGGDFFRSSLIQTAYYGLFAGWTLWHRANDGSRFEWDRMDRYLRIPFLGKLFYEFKHPDRLAELRLAPHLERAAETLGRVDAEVFFSRFKPPDIVADAAEEHPAAPSALTYFYEPFLEAFDPGLRKELGVWYTPPEIVRYQVRKIDRLLREEFGCPHGFADDRVVVLDPCCGTGAYLMEVVRVIAGELHARGDDALIGHKIREAITQRVLGFEILTAPFVVSQLQIFLALSELGVEPERGQRPAVFLTNALTGWQGEDTIKLNFPELMQERDQATRVKREAKIIVILGNPPYNRFAGTAMAEEADLVDHYKGIERVEKKDRRGKVVLGTDGRPVHVQSGESLLYKRWGISKQLLNDLYIRFFRLGEQRIGEKAEYGVVSFISNSSYLTGRSHPIMRESILKNFHEVWVDNGNGDKYRTGKIIPAGQPGAGSSDQSVFTTATDPRGIQVGTCISTFLKRRLPPSEPQGTPIHYRDFWGRADAKRRALLGSLSLDGWSEEERRSASARPGGPRAYTTFTASEATRWIFSPQDLNAGYEAWPDLEELFPLAFQGVNPNRGLEGSVVDVDREALAKRMERYLGSTAFARAQVIAPELAKDRARYDAAAMWKRVRGLGGYCAEKIVPYLLFPLDSRWLYYEPEGKFLNERRVEFWENLPANEFLVAVPQPRHISESRPFLSRTLVDLHAHDRGSVCFPRESSPGALVTERVANLRPETWQALRSAWELTGERNGPSAKRLVSELFRLALAIVNAPSFEEEHRDALAQEWAHLPIPKSRDALARIVQLGDKVATLLDPAADAEPVIDGALGRRVAAAIGVLRSTARGAPDLRLEIAYFGAAKGRWMERDYTDREPKQPAWGPRTGDLYLNGTTYFENVPERVWSYELGGYAVLKKWLGYRQVARREGRPLTLAEAQHFRSMIQRLAALLTLHAELDAAYEEAARDAFTAEELGLRGI